MSTRLCSLPSTLAALATALSIVTGLSGPATAQEPMAERGGGHFAAPDPADLAPAEAEAIYGELFEQMNRAISECTLGSGSRNVRIAFPS